MLPSLVQGYNIILFLLLFFFITCAESPRLLRTLLLKRKRAQFGGKKQPETETASLIKLYAVLILR